MPRRSPATTGSNVVRNATTNASELSSRPSRAPAATSSALGMIIGAGIMRVIDNGINMFQVRYEDNGVPRIWRLDQNWTFIIIGA